MGFRLDELLTALHEPETLRSVVWAGFGVLTLWLLVLMRTRWGQYKPLRKCVFLSVLAHLLAAGYTVTVRIEAMSNGRPREVMMNVASIDDFGESDGVEQQSQPQRPWDRFTLDTAPSPDPVDLETPQAQPLTDLDRAQVSEAAKMPVDPDLPAAPQTEFKATDPKDLASDAVERPAEAADSAAIDAPQATRRDAPSEAAPAKPELAPKSSPAAGIARQESRSTALQGVPSKLLDQPTLPPQIVNVPAMDDTAPLLLGKQDKLGHASSPAATDSTSPDAVGEETASSDNMVSVRSGRAAESGGASAVASLVDGSGGVASDIAGGAASLNPSRVSSRERNVHGQDPSEPTMSSSSPRFAPRGRRDGESQSVPELYQARTAPDRTAVAAVRGGNEETEGAVQGALAWLADAQSRDGRWDAARFGAGHEGKVLGRDRKGAGKDADTAITGLALLAFLGAGQTHQNGDYQETVRRGLEFLISAQGRDGNLGGGASLYAFMYCHGMASCALSEAYGMTHDDRLERPVRRAIGYTLKAQHATNGGWRYKPGDPQGDTSQFGWQLMALKSAELGGIEMPPKAREGMVTFLKSVASGQNGGLASYRAGEKTSRTMTAEALVCRQFLGMSRNNPASDEAGDYILADLPGDAEPNFYYWYYGTLAMYHLQGQHWERWNAALKESLLGSQRNAGSESGSWDPDPVWGKHGGRVYSTAMGALCLEVYYRYLPLYSHGPRPAGTSQVK